MFSLVLQETSSTFGWMLYGVDLRASESASSMSSGAALAVFRRISRIFETQRLAAKRTLPASQKRRLRLGEKHVTVAAVFRLNAGDFF